jgi:hypothetical protein
MQLPGLGRMMNFHVGPHTEEGSRLDTYMSRCMLKLCKTQCNVCHSLMSILQLALQLLLCANLPAQPQFIAVSNCSTRRWATD